MYAPRKGFPQKLREGWWPGVCLAGMFTHSPPPYLHRDTIVCSCLPQAFFHFFFLSFLFLKKPNIYFLFPPSPVCAFACKSPKFLSRKHHLSKSGQTWGRSRTSRWRCCTRPQFSGRSSLLPANRAGPGANLTPCPLSG